MKIEDPVQVFSCEICEISQSNIMRITVNDCSWTFRGDAEIKYYRNQRFVIEVIATVLRNKCSEKRV